MLKVLYDRVLVKRLPPIRKKGLVYLPDSAIERRDRALVIAVGEGHLNDRGEKIPLAVKPGEVVVIENYSGLEIQYGEDNLIALREQQIVGIEPEEDRDPVE